MPQTPDRKAGQREEESLLLVDEGLGLATVAGQSRYSGGRYSFFDAHGEFNPRYVTGLGKWIYQVSTTMADPGIGNFRTNNADEALVSSIALSATDGLGSNYHDQLVLVGGESFIRVAGVADPSQVLLYKIILITDNTAWIRFDVTHVSSSTTVPNFVGLAPSVFSFPPAIASIAQGDQAIVRGHQLVVFQTTVDSAWEAVPFEVTNVENDPTVVRLETNNTDFTILEAGLYSIKWTGIAKQGGNGNYIRCAINTGAGFVVVEEHNASANNGLIIANSGQVPSVEAFLVERVLAVNDIIRIEFLGDSITATDRQLIRSSASVTALTGVKGADGPPGVSGLDIRAAGYLGIWNKLADGTGTGFVGGDFAVEAGSSAAPNGITKFGMGHDDPAGDSIDSYWGRVIGGGSILRFEEALDADAYAEYRIIPEGSAPTIVSRAVLGVEYLRSSTGFTFGATNDDFNVYVSGLEGAQDLVVAHVMELTMVGTTNYYTFVAAEFWSSVNYNRSITGTPTTGVAITDLGWSPPQPGVLNSVVLSGLVLDGIAAPANQHNLAILYCDRSNFSGAQTVTDDGGLLVANFGFGPTPPYSISQSFPVARVMDKNDCVIVACKRNDAASSSTSMQLTIQYNFTIRG